MSHPSDSAEVRDLRARLKAVHASYASTFTDWQDTSSRMRQAEAKLAEIRALCSDREEWARAQVNRPPLELAVPTAMVFAILDRDA